MKDIANIARLASYFDLHHEIDSERPLRTKLYDFNFPIVNFPFICNKFSAESA